VEYVGWLFNGLVFEEGGLLAFLAAFWYGFDGLALKYWQPGDINAWLVSVYNKVKKSTKDRF
jgi:hypothetical protein